MDFRNNIHKRNDNDKIKEEDIDVEAKNKDKGEKIIKKKENLTVSIGKYGTLGIVVYIGVYIIKFGLCYLLVTSGIDFSFMENWTIVKKLGNGSEIGASLAITYAIHKLLMPVRIALSIYLTKKIQPYWNRLLSHLL